MLIPLEKVTGDILRHVENLHDGKGYERKIRHLINPYWQYFGA